jgi:dTDP-4-amino-4,6-dideoxygalactose transaminase
MEIPQANPKAQYLSHQAEIDAAITRVLQSGWYVLGREGAAFEGEFAAYVGVRHAIGVASGTEALHLALKACRVGEGDEVIAPAHTAVATVAAIELSGARPVLGDLEPILAVARRHALRVIEDCAQAVGATYHDRRVGGWGDMAAFSFYPTKNLGAIGDGGLVTTDDAELAGRARLLRQYGWRMRYISELRGWNSRLDELQAAILRVKLRHLETDTARRRQWAAIYDELLAGSTLDLPRVMAYGRHVYHLYVVRHARRDDLQAYLAGHQVGSLVHYPAPIHLQPAYRGRLGDVGSFPHAEQITRQVLSLPLYPELSEAQVRHVAGLVRRFETL